MQLASARLLSAQTFVQVQQLGSNIGPRLTQTVTQQRLNGLSLFGAIAGKVTYVDALASPPTAYEFASDRAWDRVLFGRKDDYINEFTNAASPFGRLAGPMGLDVSPLSLLFIADSRRSRVTIARFYAATKSISTQGYAGGGYLPMPVDVAWDGRLGPFWPSDAYFYVADELGKITYWHWNGVPNLDWQYGARGSGVGQFMRPSGVCVGHALGPNGGTVFTSDFYVADAGSGRLVWLRRNDNNTVSWMQSVTPAQGGIPADCTVDHFGNVYVADEQNSRILKYTASLGLLATYGTYGRGATNYNTFAHPHAIHAVFGVRPAGTSRVWYGEGRIITAEDWTSTSGGLEHWLGVDLQAPYTPVGGTGWASVPVWMTDHAYVTVEVLLDASGGTVAYPAASDFRPSGWVSADWDGLLSDGTPAPQDWYRFRITAVSGYGCDGSAWCRKTVVTDRFLTSGRDCTDPNFICPTENMVALLPGLGGAGGLPTTFFLHQLVSAYAGPLARRVDVAEDLRGLRGDPAQPGTLSAQVRARGLMALAVGVPAATTATPLTVRVYSLNGTLVRELVRESVDPGEYVVGWDGTDRDGRPVLPGVYIAVMSAGSFRGTQRLIVPRR